MKLMAAVEIGYNELKNIRPESIKIACHNSSDSCTVAGKLGAVKKFVDDRKSENVLAKMVDSAQIPFHNSFISKSISPCKIEINYHDAQKEIEEMDKHMRAEGSMG